MSFLAMNRFKVKRGQEEAFEALWLGRQTWLPTLPGFVDFALIKGPEQADHILYATHTMWRTHDDFVGWTKSEAFRKSHSGAGATGSLYQGHPQFEGFAVIQAIDASGAIVTADGKDAVSKRAALAARLQADQDGVMETLARQHGVSMLDATRMLPDSNARWVEGDAFEAVMGELTTWGDVLFLVHTPSVVLEVKAPVPPGTSGRGFFNLHGTSAIGGHLKAEDCVAIAFVRRPFMGQDSASVQFFSKSGDAMFKVYVRRDAQRKLDPGQLAQFEAMAERLASRSSSAA